jgi:hypothetical protein
MKSPNGLQKINYIVVRISLALTFVFSGLVSQVQSVAQASGGTVYPPPGVSSKPATVHTSAYLIGDVAVGVIFPESGTNGTENWTPDEKKGAITEIDEGLKLWSDAMPVGANPRLNFIVGDVNLNLEKNSLDYLPDSAPISNPDLEPISMNSFDAYQWINNVLSSYSKAPYSTDPEPAEGTSQAATNRMYHYINAFRNKLDVQADWGFIVFVVDSSSDYDHKFNNGDFYYSDLYGPYTIVSYDKDAPNDSLYGNKLNLVISREVAHIFGASYHDGCSYIPPSTPPKFGYLAIGDTNCDKTDGLMGTLSTGMTTDPDIVTQQQVGWRDSDGNGIFDPVDTNPVVTMTPFEDPTKKTQLDYKNDATHTYKVFDVPYSAAPCDAVNADQCYWLLRGSVSLTINTVASVKFQVDGGPTWNSAIAGYDSTDVGALFDTDYEYYYFDAPQSPATLTGGQHTISVQATNSVGNQSTIVTDKVTVYGVAGNDLFKDATTIDTIPYTDIVDIDLAGIETGIDGNDPVTTFCNQNRQGLQSVWYKYTATTDQAVYFDTIGSDYDTYIAVWTGDTLDALEPYPASPDTNCNDDGVPPYQSKFPLMPVAGQTYYIEVAKYGEGKGDLSGGELHFHASLESFVPDGMWTTAFNYNEGWRVDMHVRTVGDVNGDGKEDLIGFGNAGVFVCLANAAGTAFGSCSKWTTAFNYNEGWRVDMHPRMVGDVNGDGKDDLIGFGYAGVYVCLANPAGTAFGSCNMWTTALNYNEGWRVNMHPRMVADVNGDGRKDVIGFGYAGVYVATSK